MDARRLQANLASDARVGAPTMKSPIDPEASAQQFKEQLLHLGLPIFDR